jgi:hypothetical protein
MDTAAVDIPEPISEPKATPQTAQVNAKKQAAQAPAVDLYAAARYAKKIRRRKAHRATLRASHTNG